MHRRLLFLSIAAAIGLFAAAAGVRSAPLQLPALLAGDVTAMLSPAPAGSAEPRLAVDPAGRVLLSWLAPREGGGHLFQFSELKQDSWAAPRTIAEGAGMFANWADFPAMFVTRRGLMAAHWLERGTSRAAYDIRLRTSADNGRTWTDAVTPHRDGTATEHGFVSFFEAPGRGPGSGLGLIWLDGRQMRGDHGASSGAMTLRSALVSDTGLAGEDVLVDDRVCDCCPTAAAATDSGVVVAYRDRSEGEIRDIVVRRFEGGRWSEPHPVHEDGWQINGCPVNGPALSAQGSAVALAWFTAANRAPKTQLAFSNDGGRTFGAPVRVDSGTTLGRTGVALVAADRAVVSWIDNTGAAARFTVREAAAGGALGAPVVVSPVSGQRTSGFPQVVVAGGRLIAAWTHVEGDGSTRIGVARARLAR